MCNCINKNLLFLGNHFIPLLFVLFFIYSCSNSSSQGYLIKGYIEGDEQQILKGVVYLRHVSNYALPIDSALVIDGKFLLNGYIATPDNYLLFIKGIPNAIPLFLENNKYIIEGSSKSIRESNVSGGVSNLLFTITTKKSDEIYNEYNLNEVLPLLVEMNKSDPKREILVDILDSANAKMKFFIDSLSSSNPLSFYSLYQLMINSRSANLSIVEKKFEVFKKDSQFIKHPYYKQIKSNIDIRTKLLPGKLTPIFSLYDSSSKLRSIEEIYLNNSFTIILFCSSSNEACIEYCKSLRDAYGTLRTNNIDIVSISINDEQQHWKVIMEEEKFKWIHLFDSTDSGIQLLYNLQTIPRAYLVDSLGTIVNNNFQLKDLQSLF